MLLGLMRWFKILGFRFRAQVSGFKIYVPGFRFKVSGDMFMRFQVQVPGSSI